MMLATVVAMMLGATGTHQRWDTERGPVHTWRPGPTVPTTVVVYVHGYRDDADSAFEGHRLAEQFSSSGLDALFVVPEAPSGPSQAVAWPDLEQLLAEVAAHHAAPLPAEVLVLGHSGGNRTLKAWLASARVTRVILLDGFYGDPRPFERWLATAPQAQLVMVSQLTFSRAEAWRSGLAPALRARVTHRWAGCSHMELVTGGSWLPRLLQAATPPAASAG